MPIKLVFSHKFLLLVKDVAAKEKYIFFKVRVKS